MINPKVVKLFFEFAFLNTIMYFIIRFFEILFSLIASNKTTKFGIDILLFGQFSTISIIIGCIFSCCALKWEYGVRETIRIQNDREHERMVKKILEGLEDIEINNMENGKINRNPITYNPEENIIINDKKIRIFERRKNIIVDETSNGIMLV